MSDSMMASLYSYGPIVLMVIIFYFLLYRPQKKQQKQRNTMMDNLKVGHRILTIGGIHGEITYIDLEKSDFESIDEIDHDDTKRDRDWINRQQDDRLPWSKRTNTTINNNYSSNRNTDLLNKLLNNL